MNGRNHLKMGACTVGVVSAVGLVPFTEAPASVAAGIGLFLFAKVSPDLDHPGSSITRSWGPVTRLLSWAIIRPAARLAYATTRAQADPPRAAVHRGFTHTAPGAVAAGLVLAWALLSGPWWAAGTLALAIGGAAYVYDRGTQVWAALAAGAVGYLAWPELVVAAPWIGFAVALGCFAHAVDDCVTTAGAPLRFPLRDRETGRRWRRVGTPEWMRFDTGSGMETAVVWGAIVATSGLLYWLVLAPWLAPYLLDTFGGAVG